MSQRARRFVVRVLLQGAGELECGQAVEEMKQELRQRGYLGPAVDWHSGLNGLTFQVEEEAADAESAGLFVQDEIVEVGSMFLPNFDRFSVVVLSSEPLEPEEEIWASTPTLTVSHWPAHVLAVLSGLVFALFTALGVVARSPLISAFFLAWLLACIWLVISYGKSVLTNKGVTHTAPIGKRAIGWDEIRAAVIDSGGNTIVLKAEGKQLVLPHFVFWAGRDKLDAMEAFSHELERRGIQPKRGFAAFAISRNTSVR